MASEAGILLKQHLGLTAFPKVYYARVIGIAAYKIYFIFFDSRIPLANLTSWESFRKEFAPVIPFKDGGRRLSLTNILPIEEWSGSEPTSLFIRVDLCGRFLQPFAYAMTERRNSFGLSIVDICVDSPLKLIEIVPSLLGKILS